MICLYYIYLSGIRLLRAYSEADPSKHLHRPSVKLKSLFQIIYAGSHFQETNPDNPTNQAKPTARYPVKGVPIDDAEATGIA